MRILVDAIKGANQSIQVAVGEASVGYQSILLTPEIARWVAERLVREANKVEAWGGASEKVAKECTCPPQETSS